ncbi:oligosaccharide flippase family protein [uncultured Oscillibacter sp.]|uniref:oligosaccharide flippase family protein n=1 Tax=uncultured Oscillibacter sp. TaxID=876091 RepID=UPI00261FEBFF|nr:oligosaccharide flippase family protein [uncultured Oscillibacter sp.]
MIEKLVQRYKAVPIPVRASMWFAGCSFLQRGISMITTPIFTRLLSSADYGRIGVFNSWMSILSVFVTLNLSAGIFMQGLVKFSAERERFSSAMYGLCTTVTAVWLVVYLLFQDLWNELFSLTAVQMLGMLLLIWCSAMASFWSMQQRIDFHYRKLVLLSVLVSVANPIVGIVLVLHAEDKAMARILGIVLVEALAYSWTFFAQMRRDHTFFSGSIWRYALRFNIPLIPHYLASAVLSGADRIMIEDLVGSSEAGIYNLAYSVSLIMTIFNSAMLQTIEPWLYRKIGSRKTEDIPSVAYPCFVGIALVNVFLIALAPEIVAVFAPPAYHDAIWVIPPVAMSVYFTFSYSFFAVFEFYYEKTFYIALSTVGGAVLNVALNAVFIRIYGYYAAGYTTLICYMVYAVLHFACMHRLCRKKLGITKLYDMRILLTITFGFMAAGFALLSTYRTPAIRYALIAGLMIALFMMRGQILDRTKRLLQLKKSD